MSIAIVSEDVWIGDCRAPNIPPQNIVITNIDISDMGGIASSRSGVNMALWDGENLQMYINMTPAKAREISSALLIAADSHDKFQAERK